VGAVPGVSSASLAASVPLLGMSRRATVIEGYQPQPGEDTETACNIVGPRFFDMMRITVLPGRAVTEADRSDAPPVVVNDAFCVEVLAEHLSPLKSTAYARSGTGDDPARTFVGHLTPGPCRRGSRIDAARRSSRLATEPR
jgi:hypothetical protein